jgi:phosphatidylserine/phosphatidylglycerophosphate/cardiolipin synthase-like enzyme
MKMSPNIQKICSVGSANMDYRSFALNFEVNAFIYDEEIAKEIRALTLIESERLLYFSKVNNFDFLMSSSYATLISLAISSS